MPESLLNKYPHLKLLLSESREKRAHLADEKKAEAKIEKLPDEIIAPPRKSILGPGVGPRIDCKVPVKTYDSKRYVVYSSLLQYSNLLILASTGK